MTHLAVERLSASEKLALRASLDAEMARDDTYQETPIGYEVRRFIDYQRWKSISDHTIANREGPLRLLSLETRGGAYLTLADLDGRQGARVIEAFLMREWGRTADNTRANRAGVLRAFFKWAYREGLVDKDPMDFVETPRRRGRRRDAHAKERIAKLVGAQQRRDRLAIRLMARQALRKGELRGVQLGHFDFAAGTLSIFGKGSKFAVVKLFADVAREAETYAQERAFENPDGWRAEYLLFPRKSYRRGHYPDYTWHEKSLRTRPLSSAATQTWWQECTDRAGLKRFAMHELRHTAATDFHLGPAKKDFELTRQFLRHEHLETTVGYIHTPPAQLERAIIESEQE